MNKGQGFSVTIKNFLLDTVQPSSGRRNNLAFIQGMRGFAMLAIFLLHSVVQFGPGYFPPGSFTQAFASGVFILVPAAVDLFFLISGYFMYAKLIETRPPVGSYLFTRLRRIYPVYLVMLLIYVALSLAFPAFSKFPAGPGAAAIYLVQNLLMLPGVFNIPPLMAVAWIMSYLLFWTLLLPVLLNVLKMRTWLPVWRIVFWLALTGVALVLYSRFSGPIRLTSFIAGFVLYDLLRCGYTNRLPTGAGLVAIPVMCVLIVLTPVDLAGLTVRMIVVFAGLFILCLDPFLRSGGLTERFFNWRPFTWLGDFSYSFFLTHGLVLKAAGVMATRLFPPVHTPRDLIVFWLMPVVMLPVALIAALAMYNLVERPFSARKTKSPELLESRAET